jgi:hypothetical protein
MSIIRFNIEDTFTTDSSDYDILIEAAELSRDVPGMAIEIGTRRGGSAKMIIDALVGTNKGMICVDPYGNIEIECTNMNVTHHMPSVTVEGDPLSTEITQPLRFDYDNTMRNRVIPSLYYYAFMQGLDFRFFCLEDSEFFARYSDGIPFYNNEKTVINEYSHVNFDGPHSDDKVLEEVKFFISRTPSIGATYCFDDCWMYSHFEKIHPLLLENGFDLLNKGNVKASYIKSS